MDKLKKTITVKLIGGLGNQLHCFAFAYALAKKRNTILIIDCDSGFWNDIYNRIFLLDLFPHISYKKKFYSPFSK